MRVRLRGKHMLIAAAVALMGFGICGDGLTAEKERDCQWTQTKAFTFRVHPFPYGADIDIKVLYSAQLNQAGTVRLCLLSLEADPWGYAKLESVIARKSDWRPGGHRVELEIRSKVWLNPITPDVVDGEITPLYEPTQEPIEVTRAIPGFGWGAKSCPEIRMIQPRSAKVTFEGHMIPERTYATRVKDVQGDARIKNDAGGSQRPAPGMELKPGDTIETKAGEVTFHTIAAKVKVGAHSAVKLAYNELVPGPAKYFLELVHGFLFARAKKDPNSLKVATPNAICGVRGTKYTIRHDKATTTTVVAVEEGVVAFSDVKNRKTVEVQAGMKSLIKGNGLPSNPVAIR